MCGAVFIAAGMVGEDWLKVALTAMALGVGLYLIPLGMIANPELIALGTEPIAALATAVQMGAALVLLSFALIARGRPAARLGALVLGAAILFGRAFL